MPEWRKMASSSYGSTRAAVDGRRSISDDGGSCSLSRVWENVLDETIPCRLMSISSTSTWCLREYDVAFRTTSLVCVSHGGASNV